MHYAVWSLETELFSELCAQSKADLTAFDFAQAVEAANSKFPENSVLVVAPCLEKASPPQRSAVCSVFIACGSRVL